MNLLDQRRTLLVDHIAASQRRSRKRNRAAQFAWHATNAAFGQYRFWEHDEAEMDFRRPRNDNTDYGLMSMNDMQQYLARAAEELGLEIRIAYLVTLSDGREFSSEALFPDLGSLRGTLIFRSSAAPDAGIRRYLSAQGYGISTLSEPRPNEVFDVANYADMFFEWGWCGDPARRPWWMTED